jgi:hypothetical protein
VGATGLEEEEEEDEMLPLKYHWHITVGTPARVTRNMLKRIDVYIQKAQTIFYELPLRFHWTELKIKYFLVGCSFKWIKCTVFI